MSKQVVMTQFPSRSPDRNPASREPTDLSPKGTDKSVSFLLSRFLWILTGVCQFPTSPIPGYEHADDNPAKSHELRPAPWG